MKNRSNATKFVTIVAALTVAAILSVNATAQSAQVQGVINACSGPNVTT
jgi:hypothetical protein